MNMDWKDKIAREDRRYTVAAVFNPAFPKITCKNGLLIMFHTCEWPCPYQEGYRKVYVKT